MRQSFHFIEDENAPKNDLAYADVLYNATGLVFTGKLNRQTKEVIKNGIKFLKNDNDDKYLFKVHDNIVSIFDKEGKLRLYNVTVNW